MNPMNWIGSDWIGIDLATEQVACVICSRARQQAGFGLVLVSDSRFAMALHIPYSDGVGGTSRVHGLVVLFPFDC